jgi:hypothetical protein
MARDFQVLEDQELDKELRPVNFKVNIMIANNEFIC